MIPGRARPLRWLVLAGLVLSGCASSTRVDIRSSPSADTRSTDTVAGSVAAPASTAPGDTSASTSAPGQSAAATTTTRPVDCTGLAPMTAADRTLAMGDDVRTYRLSLPRGYDNTWAAPVVVSLPGYGATAAEFDAVTSISKVAKRRGFIVVTPDAAADPPSWNVRADPDRLDDFAFIHALTAEVRQILCVEQDHFFVLGHANGGKFAAAVACSSPPEFAGLALVSASELPTCADDVQPPFLAIAGTADETNPYEGDGAKQPGAIEAVEAWATHDGCAAQPVTVDLAVGVQALEYAECVAGKVALITVTGGANPWPGGTIAAVYDGNSEAGRTFDATDAVMDFFKDLVDEG
ncbi:MAG: plasmid partitioning protein [Actinobacteria bacterium]|nr:plasmid partitioning protein [Actinomycetota bacterium]